VHDQGVRTGARGGLLRWQLAPHLTAAGLTEHSVLIRDGASSGVATIFLRGAAPVRIVTRDVSPRFGQRVTAQCLELPLDISLEALTIVVPTGGDGAVVSFEEDAHHPERGVRWTDAAGRNHVVMGAAQAPQLPAGPQLDPGLTWWVERMDAAVVHHEEGGLIAALQTEAPQVPADVQAVTHMAEQSGRMIVLANIHGPRWEKLGVAAPRRG